MAQLFTCPVNEFIDIAMIVGEQDEALEILDPRARVVRKAGEREIGPQSIEQRQGDRRAVKVDAIGQFATLPEAEALAAANKRIGNILKKADIAIPHGIDRSQLNDPVESALAEAVEAALGDTDEALHHHDYIRVLSRLAVLRPQVDAFFDSVMVNVDDVAVRGNRLALLKRLVDRFRAVAAIEHLSS